MWTRWCGAARPASGEEPLRLHIGGQQRKPGWKIIDVQARPEVDYVGDCIEVLRRFADGSVQEVYASHVLEHLGYREALPRALGEMHRVLRPGGAAMISVPDFEFICRRFLEPGATGKERFHLMRIAFGGQDDPHDFHHVGLTLEFLRDYLYRAGFTRVERVKEFGLFNDDSGLALGGELLSLNVVAYK
jgi:predicted SAM-dependent methyltransferase